MNTNDPILERLNQHPVIKARVEKLLTIVENPSGESNLADEAEKQVIESFREFGKEILQEWGETRNSQASVQLEKQVRSACKNQKKVYWQTTFGQIKIQEQTYYQPKGGSILRPFLLSCGVACRGYSLPFQRRIVDFGADVPFGQISSKLKEHYGIEAAQSTLRLITLRHAHKFKQKEHGEMGRNKNLPAKECIISQTDGCMVPIVKTQPKQPGNQDRRKKKDLLYKEARLTLSHEKGSVSPRFSATMGSVEKMGQHIRHCVELIGLGEDTKIHCVGDGASWIVGQVEEQFGTQATYLIDFYHLCEYLAAACRSLKQDGAWMERQKNLLKENKANQVLKELSESIEDKSIPDSEAPVRVCSRYLSNRLEHLDYQSALENDLPIGSGEIESAHRYIIQERLKRPGAWWLDKHAEDMMALRTQRANHQWDTYWKRAA